MSSQVSSTGVVTATYRSGAEIKSRSFVPEAERGGAGTTRGAGAVEPLPERQGSR